jgi:hypothetical protein
MGREEERKRAAAFAGAQQFAAGVRSGEVPALDRFGQPLVVGSFVLYHPSVDLMFQVTEVKPVLDPRAPTGLVTVTLAVEIPITLKAGLAQMALVRLGMAQPVAVPDVERPSPEEEPAASGPKLVVTDAD